MSAFSVLIGEIKTDIKEVGSWIKGVDWAQEVAYWQEFVKGLETVVAPVVEALFPGTTSTIKEVVTPVLDNANKAVTALGTAVQDYSAGNLSSAELTTVAHAVQSAAVAANTIVGVAVAAKKS
jgi:hypothetical protein